MSVAKFPRTDGNLTPLELLYNSFGQLFTHRVPVFQALAQHWFAVAININDKNGEKLPIL